MKRKVVNIDDELFEKKIKLSGAPMNLIRFPDQDEQYNYIYAGTLSRKKGKYWVARIQTKVDGKSTEMSKWFRDDTYGGEDNAKKTAEEYRRKLSDELGKTIKRARTDIIMKQTREWLSGFFDGDGMVRLDDKKAKSERYYGIVQFTQASSQGQPKILTHIQNLYGGYIVSKGNSSASQRPAYDLRIAQSSDLIVVLNHLRDHAILKRDQINLVLNYTDLPRTEQINERKKITFNTLQHAKLLSSYQNVIIPTERITNSYVSGLFEAEGWISIYKTKYNCYSVEMGIAQKSSSSLLHLINEHFGNRGTVRVRDGVEVELRWKSRDTVLSIVQRLISTLIGSKHKQAEIVVKYCTMQKGHNYTDDQHEQIKLWISELTALKNA